MKEKVQWYTHTISQSMKLVLIKQTLMEIMLIKSNQDNEGPQYKYLKKS